MVVLRILIVAALVALGASTPLGTTAYADPPVSRLP